MVPGTDPLSPVEGLVVPRRPLRIGYLLAALRPGGAERQMLALAQRLPQDRFTADLLTLSGEGEYDDLARSAGLRVVHLGTPRHAGMSALNTLVSRASKITNYVTSARRARYDIIDVWLYPSDVLVASLRYLTGTPAIVSGRRNVDPHGAFGPLDPIVDRMVDRLVDRVVANSQAAADHAIRTQHVDPRKVRVIRNGVEIPPAPDERQRLEARRDLGVGPNDLVIGSVANYQPVKGHLDLVEAFRPIAEAVPSARLVLVGEGPIRASLDEWISRHSMADQVLLHGHDLDTRRLYPGFDLVVQSSHREGLPNALLEAASAGRPIVATAAGGTAEIVLDGVTGLIVPIGDIAAISAALRRLVLDERLRRSLGAAAYEHVRTTFSMDRFVREFAATYDEVYRLKRGRRSAA